MKMILSLLILLSTQFSFAGPGATPIFPWPTSVGPKHELLFEDLRGEWVGYSQNTLWFVNIDYNFSSPDGLAAIEIRSSALFTTYGFGWLKSWEKVFWGEVTMDDNHKTSFIIYKDTEGTKLRMGKNAKSYFDVILYRK